MNQKPTIKKIKKCKKDSLTLSLQETEKLFGVKKNGCSTFLSCSGLLAQGEVDNRKLNQRNPVVTFRDPKTCKLKGEDLSFLLS